MKFNRLLIAIIAFTATLGLLGEVVGGLLG